MTVLNLKVTVVTSAILFLVVLTQIVQAENPCCSFPCKNRGICMRGKDLVSYTCDCANLEFYGKHCETLRANILDTPALYDTVHEYPTVTAHTNYSVYARTLPPVPEDCPTPMGTKGFKELPDVQKMIKKLFTRKEFRPEPMGSSLIFTFFAQHFTHMFFKTKYHEHPGNTWTGHGVDVSSIYGTTVGDEHLLRSFKDGKLKMQVLNNELYPMYTSDVPINMTYLPGVPDDAKFAMGHPFFGLLPGLFLYQTIWMREHNRVCDIMKTEHPDWDDERLFQTGKLIILGETIKIVIEDYVQHLANYNIQLRFNPSVLFDQPFQYRNKINVEFDHIYHWHPLMPDSFLIDGTNYTMKEFLFHSELVVKHGTSAFTDSLSRQRAGHMAHHNHGSATIHVLRDTILHGRTLRFQSLNNYRERFNLRRYTSFEDLTGDVSLAKELEDLYGDVDAVEFYVGVLLEKRRRRALFGETVVEIGGPFSVKGLLANPICSKQYWRPSTFGGDVGFDIVKTATIEKLFCGNIDGPCPLVSMRVPDWVEGDVDEFNNFEPPKRDEL